MSKEDEGEGEEVTNIGVGRYPCMPSLVALQQMRNRLHLAYLGKKLMKWTALATGRELRKIATDLDASYVGFGEDLANAYMLLARSRYYYPNLNKMVIEDVQKKAHISLVTTIKPLSAGVRCATYEVLETDQRPYPHLGIDKGGQTILETKIAWENLLKKMVLIVELRYSFQAIDTAHRSATKKANVLQKLIIPKTQETIKYIVMELEEISREELYRIKKVVQKKKKKEVPKKKKKEKPPPPPPPPPPKPEPIPEPIKIEPEIPELICVAEQPSESESEEEVFKVPPPVCPTKVCKGPSIPCAKEVAPAAAEADQSELQDFIKSIDFGKIQPPPPSVVCDSLQKLLKRTISEALSVKLKQISSKSNMAYLSAKKSILESDPREMLPTLSIENFNKLCANVKTKVSEIIYPTSSNANKDRLLRLKAKVSEIKGACNDLKSKMKDSQGLTELLQKCAQVDGRINTLMDKQKMLDRNKQLDILNDYIKDIETMTREFQNQGTNIPGAEEFILHCKGVQSRLKSYKQPQEPYYYEDTRLKLLQSQVANVEDVARSVESKSFEKFTKCCKDFRAKIETFEKQPQQNKAALKPIIDRLDQAIELTKYAKEDGFVDESFESFIGTCAKTKKYLLEKQTPTTPCTHPVLGELKKSIVDAMDLVNKMKREGLLEDSLTDFMKSCQHTRKTITVNETALKRPPKHEDDDENDSETCECELCVCTSNKYYEKIHSFIRSTKREPMPPFKEPPSKNKSKTHKNQKCCKSDIRQSSSISKEPSADSTAKETDSLISRGPSDVSFLQSSDAVSRKSSDILFTGPSAVPHKHHTATHPLVSEHHTPSHPPVRSVRIADGDVKIFGDNVHETVTYKTIVHEDGTVTEVEEKFIVKLESDDTLHSIPSSDSGKSVKSTTRKLPGNQPYGIIKDRTSSDEKSKGDKPTDGILKDNKPKVDKTIDADALKDENDKPISSKDKSTDDKTEDKSKDKPRSSKDKDVAFCTSNTFGFFPIRMVKSETLCVAEPITLPSLRHCISVTLHKHSDVTLPCESSYSILESLHTYSQIGY